MIELKSFQYYWVEWHDDHTVEVVQALICDECCYSFDRFKVLKAITPPTTNVIPLHHTKS